MDQTLADAAVSVLCGRRKAPHGVDVWSPWTGSGTRQRAELDNQAREYTLLPAYTILLSERTLLVPEIYLETIRTLSCI